MKLSHVIFDFDGVFTDNFVYTSSEGIEFIKTSRSDSYALSEWKKNPLFAQIVLTIVSTETDPVVSKRANKLGIKCYSGVKEKEKLIEEIFLKEENPITSIEKHWKSTAFVGNDLNDLIAMQKAGYAFCPSDAHPKIKKIATKVFNKRGGDGFVREVLEYLQTRKLQEKN
jgi:YrbI family 3-deoxy-D-manno-octulosonate 8-phosphate phosphatase